MVSRLLHGRYRAIRSLGREGNTYVAIDTHHPRQLECIVKQLKPASADPNVLDMVRRLFAREAEILERLGNHDQIPRLLAYFEQEEEFYLVQEFIDGHSLSAELHQGQRWHEAQVLELLKETLSVLTFIHSQGVIHRDIKPDNIIRRSHDNKLVLIDFGAVKQVRLQLPMLIGQTNVAVVVSTPGYMPREQALGRPRLSSDIYAVGMIGIQSLTGVMPNFLPEDEKGEVIWRPLVEVSDAFASVLSRMVRYNYMERYQSAAEALSALTLFTPQHLLLSLNQRETSQDIGNESVPFEQSTETLRAEGTAVTSQQQITQVSADVQTNSEYVLEQTQEIQVSFNQIINLLQQAQLDLSAEDIADALWLARYLEAEEATVEVEGLIAEPTPVVDAPNRELLPPLQTEFVPSEPKALIYPSEPVASPLPAAPKTQGIPFQAPAAVALRTPLDLARSLRPLMRRVESRTNLVLDEEATAEEIADREVWSPVLRPDRERWLELAIVVEASRSTAIWQSTVAEFQKLMEVQGAFRDVRTWSLTTGEDGKPQLFPRRGNVAVQHRPRSPKELIDPAGRRLILVVSDCISPMWRQGQIHPLLKQWSEAGLLATVQLLPERLWVRSALGTGFPVQLSALSPGVANSKLQVEGLPIWEEIHPATAIPLPVVTLEPEPLHQWAKVVAGIGSTQTAGIVFDSSLLALQLQAESELTAQTAVDRLSPEELVKRFRATASPTARKLAGLMVAAPVSLPVVHLLQETLLKDSRQVHVAEVFMSGLLQPTSEATETVQYEFVDGVRDILLDAVPAPRIDAVLEAVSQYVANRAGLSIRNFAALLVPHPEWNDSTRQMILPFAEVAKHVLQRLGGEYARVAEQLEQTAQGIAQRFREAPPDLSAFPELRSFEFEVATFTEEDSPSVPEWKKQIVQSLQEWMQAYLALERECERAEQFASESNAISQRVRLLRVRPGDGMEQVRAAFNNQFPSQNALAEAAGVTRSTVHEFLTGELIHRETFEKLCRHLSLSPEEIADRDSDELPIPTLRIPTTETLKVKRECLNQVWAAIQGRFGTQQALAEASRLSRATVNKFLAGEPVNRATFEDLCARLSLDPNEIAGRTSSETFSRNLQAGLAYEVAFHNVVASLQSSNLQTLLDSIWSEREILTQRYTQLTRNHQAVQKLWSSGAINRNELEKLLETINQELEEINLRLSAIEAESQNQLIIEALNAYLKNRSSEWLDFDFVDLSTLVTNSARHSESPYRNTNTIQAVLHELYEASLAQLERSSSEQASARRQRRDVIRLALSQAITGLAVILVSDTFLLSPYASLTLGCAGIAQAKDSLTSRPLQTFEFTTVKVDARGQEVQRKRLTAQFYTEDLGNEVRLEMVAIPGGRFEMGSPLNEPKRREFESPQHLVTVQPFFMGKHLVTQEQWRVVAGLPQVVRELALDPSSFKGDDRPVENVSWYDAVEFCDRLSQYTERVYRLPSEAEWEYACRAGATTPFYFGETITSRLANYAGVSTYREESKGEYLRKTTPVGCFLPNELGLFDMHGNVWEWCADQWHESYEGAPIDGSTWLSDDKRIGRLLRGGAWDYNPENCRCASRSWYAPDYRNNAFGFRIVRSLEQIP